MLGGREGRGGSGRAGKGREPAAVVTSSLLVGVDLPLLLSSVQTTRLEEGNTATRNTKTIAETQNLPWENSLPIAQS